MANYLLLYHGGGMPESEDEKQKVMAAWGVWMKQCGENLVDAGNPCSNVKVVNKESVNEFSGDRVTGYSVIKANSMEEAIKAAQMVPLVADGSGSVDVYETFAAM
jgi:hypothetical protein